MVYTSTITSKGQITIPKKLRDIFGFKQGEKVFIKPEPEKGEIKVKSSPSIFELAGTLKPKRKVENAVKLREKMAHAYGSR